MKKLVILFLLCLPTFVQAFGQTLEESVAASAKSLDASIRKAKVANVAVVDFSDLQGESTELGRLLSEELSTALVQIGDSYTVVDRAYLGQILKEHKLSSSGLVDPANSKKLGQIIGVDALIVGSISTSGNNLRWNARIVSVETARVIGAASSTILLSDELRSLAGASLQQGDTSVLNSSPKRQTTRDDKFEVNLERVELKNLEYRLGMNLIISLKNVSNQKLKFHLTQSETGYTSSSGLICNPWENLNLWSIRVNDNYWTSQAVEVSPNETVTITADDMPCHEGQKYDKSARAQLSLGLVGEAQLNLFHARFHFENPDILPH